MRFRGRRATPVLLVFAGALALPGCGGGGRSSTGSTVLPTPTATPTPAVPTSGTPSAVDGISGAAVAATFSPDAPTLSSTVQAQASGYLLREQLFDGRPIVLWPGSLPYVNQLVYDWDSVDFRMVRWQRPFVVTLADDLANDAQVVAKLREVIGEVGRVTGMTLTVGPGGPVVVRVDPSVAELDAVAVTDLTILGANVTRADVRFETRQEITGAFRTEYQNTLLHEMGHVMGLGHSPSRSDVMTPWNGPGTRVAEYQRDEATCLTMMYFHRRAGNTSPDRDPALSALASGERRVRILD
jgi:hypothetical protein